MPKVLDVRDELMPSTKNLSEVLADVSLVCYELAIYEHECLVFESLPVIHIPQHYHEVELLTLFIADKVHLKPEEPVHETLAP